MNYELIYISYHQVANFCYFLFLNMVKGTGRVLKVLRTVQYQVPGTVILGADGQKKNIVLVEDENSQVGIRFLDEVEDEEERRMHDNENMYE
jgi:hypothetical protein